MDRKIFFRGHAIGGKGKWVYGNCLIQNVAGVYYIANDIAPSKTDLNHNYTEVINVGQFTGKQDVKKKDIYEDDILKITKYGRTFLAVVRWNKEYSSWCLQICGESHIGCRTLGDWLRYDVLEVVGNIHDNSELLKGGAE